MCCVQQSAHYKFTAQECLQSAAGRLKVCNEILSRQNAFYNINIVWYKTAKVPSPGYMSHVDEGRMDRIMFTTMLPMLLSARVIKGAVCVFCQLLLSLVCCEHVCFELTVPASI